MKLGPELSCHYPHLLRSHHREISLLISAINIRDNPNIHGFDCNGTEIKESMYADDTTLLLNDFNSLDNAIDTVNKFSQVAGPKLNKDKTEGILLGTLKDQVPSHNGINFTNNAVRVLGVYIGHNKNQCYTKNWTDKLDKIKLVFERWKWRKLTIFGKILIIKSLATSKLIHTMTILCTPDDILKEIEKLIFNFLWDSTDKIKRKTLIGNKYNGGIGMLDIYCKDKALKAGWIKRLQHKCNLSDLVNMYLGKYGLNIDYLIKSTVTNPNVFIKELKLPKFWAQMFASLNECKTPKKLERLSDYEFLTMPLWFNKHLIFKNKIIHFKNWSKSNLLYVRDLYKTNGNFISENVLFQTLANKSNWIQEYSITKKVLGKIHEDFSTENAMYINLKPGWTILVNNTIHSLKTQKSSFFYEILTKKKFTKNYMQKVWECVLDKPNIAWHKIYRQRVWDLTDKKLAEFNYKLLCNILCTRNKIAKWNKNLDSNCPYCNCEQNVRHLVFECSRVKCLWAIVGHILKLDVQYKHLILGDDETNTFIKGRNLLINYICYGLYKYWVLSENGKINFNTSCIIKEEAPGRKLAKILIPDGLPP